MKIRAFHILLAVSMILSACSKKDNSVGPGGIIPVPENGVYKLIFQDVATTLPSSVNIFFNVTDTAGTPVPQLTADRFIVLENGVPVNHTTSAMAVQKRANMNYRFKTVLMLDASSASPLEAVKTAARAFIAMIDPQQSIAVYRFSTTTELLQDFTQDEEQLSAAIDAMTQGPATRNLFNAIAAGVALFEEKYSPSSVLQSQCVVFSAGNDTGNDSVKREETIYTSTFGDVYVIGLGNDLDTDFLAKVGNAGFIKAAEAGGLSEAFTKTETSINQLANSYYRLVYSSTLRGNVDHDLQVLVGGNLYGGPHSSLSTLFNSKDLLDVNKGLYVNWSKSRGRGVDTLTVGAAVSQKAAALSMGGDKYPVFRWTSPDPQILKIETANEGSNEAFLKTLTEGTTSLVVEDIANGIADTIVVRAMLKYDGFVLREWWMNITGTTIRDLTSNPNYPDSPTGHAFINKFETPAAFGDNYGTRVRGYVIPPTTGSYSFWIASDDGSNLFLSTDESSENKVLIASVSTWANAREYTKETGQHSAAVELVAGKSYYIEALQKDGTGGDNLSVAWDGPGITRTEIAGQYLSAWLGN